MIGAIVGDILGSAYEWSPVKTVDFRLFAPGSRFTDDTVMTVATANAIMGAKPYAATYREWFKRHPGAGYGRNFAAWAADPDGQAYGSFGNGSAMRVSPVGWAYATLDEVQKEAALSAAVTHNHPEGVRGALAVSSSVFLARKGASKEEIRAYVENSFTGYDLSRELDDIRAGYSFDVTCLGSVPEALIAFLESVDYESAVRLAVSLGGDADTQACIAGAVAEAFYGGVPKHLAENALGLLTTDLLLVCKDFCGEFLKVP